MRPLRIWLFALTLTGSALAQPSARFDDVPATPPPPKPLPKPPAHHESWATSAARELTSRAEARWRVGDTGNALRLYTEAVRMDPGFGPAYLGLGTLREAVGDLNEALRVYTLATRVRDGRALAFERRALLEKKLNNERQAFDDLQVAVDLAPDDISRRERLGRWYVEGRAWGAALAVWRGVVAELEKRSDAGAELARARVQVRALTLLAADVDPVTGPGSRESWVRASLSSIAQRSF